MAGKTEYKNDWAKENLDQVRLTVPKGIKEKIRNRATQKGYSSINAYLNNLIKEDMGEKYE